MSDRFAELTVDELFARFRTSGRPRYLAAVFDRTAPELLRVAIHLTEDPARAEDLLQSTYLEAIRSARRFDSGRRVLPWLLGILGNLGREARRRDGRRVDELRLPVKEPVDPATVAEGGEFTRAVDDAIAQLPEVYRAVLVLHLRHHLAPADIGHALGRSPGTVRSQLARGLERLRGILPAGFAGALALVVTPGRGLAAVRRVVVSRGLVAGPGLWLTALVARLFANEVTLGAVAAAAIAAVAATFMLVGGVESQRSMPDAATAAATPAAIDEPANAVPERRHVRTDAAMPRSSAQLRVRLRGIDRLAGIVVGIRPRSGSDPLLTERRQRTDERGIARFADLEPGAYAVRADRLTGPDLVLEPGESELVELDLSGGVSVRGRVVDTTGRPVSDATIWLGERGFADELVPVGPAEPDGTFALAGVGIDHMVVAFADGYVPCRPQSVGGGDLELQLERRAGSVFGRVVDEQGQPIAGALVRIGGEGRPFHMLDPDGGEPRLVTNRPPVTARTDASGRFETGSAPAGRGVRVYARARGYVGDSTRIDLPRGRTIRHEFVLAEGGTIVGRVADADGPVSGASVVCGELDHSAPLWMAPAGRTNGDGEYRVEGVRPGEVVVTVRPGARGATSRRLTVVRGEQVRWNVALDALPALSGRVIDERGGPLSGMVVRVYGLRTWEQSTDADGRFRVVVPEQVEHRLVVRDPRGFADGRVAIREGLTASGDELQIVVPEERRPSAFLSGVVLDALDQPVPDAKVRLRLPGVGSWDAVGVDERSGRFRAGPLVPDRYEVRVVSPRFAVHNPGILELVAGRDHDLGFIALRAGGRVAVRIVEAERPVKGWVQVRVDGPDGRLAYSQDAVSTTHTTGIVPAGRCRVVVWSSRCPFVAREVEVRPGDTAELEIAIDGAVTQPIELTGLLDGEIRTDRPGVHVEWHDHTREVRAEADYLPEPPEVLRLTPRLWPGRYTVTATSSTGAKGSATFRVEDAAEPVRIRLTR